MASADFLVYRNTEPNPRPPLVRAISFCQSLLHLLIKDVGCRRWHDVLPYPPSLASVCNFCSSVPAFVVPLPSLLPSPATSLRLTNRLVLPGFNLSVQFSQQACKGFSPSGYMSTHTSLLLTNKFVFFEFIHSFRVGALQAHAGHTHTV